MADLRDILQQAGVSAESLDRIRLAPGVVGKSSYVAGAALLVLLVAAYESKEPGLIGIGAVVLFVIYFVGVLWFANKNPGVALLEGAELIRWRQMEMGVKGAPGILAGPNVEPPAQLRGQDT